MLAFSHSPKMSSFSFPRHERLKSPKTIERLFADGVSFSSFPLRLVYLIEATSASNSTIQLAATVPKKKFPKAVDRNRIRRQVKESFRLEKPELMLALAKQAPLALSIMIIYTANESLGYQKIERAAKFLSRKLPKEINQEK